MHSTQPGRLSRWLLRRDFTRGLLGSLALAALLPSCSWVTPAEISDEQSACERSQRLQDVELYDGSFGVGTSFVDRHRRAVGMLRWRSDLALRYREEAGNVSGRGWCTGTLISDDLFLTAGHCLDNDDSGAWRLPREKGGKHLGPEELAREFVVEFRYEATASSSTPSATDVVSVVRLEELRYDGVDYAILRLDGHPGLRNGVTRIASHNPLPSAPIAILQHPSAEPMKIGGGTVSAVVGSRLSYDAIDTFGGSSGAGILDAVSGKLVGIHTNGGCSKAGGDNYGVAIEALVAASPTLREFADDSRDFFVADWDRDGRSDLAVLYDGCLYPDTNHDERPDFDYEECPANVDGTQYFVGRWAPSQPPSLAWRRGGCMYFSDRPDRPLCFGSDADRFDVLLLDWDGDGQSDLAIRRDNCFAIDTNRDGSADVTKYCFGNGSAEDEYLAMKWKNSARDSVAVRRGNALVIDVNRDGASPVTLVYGSGGNEDQYLVGDWLGTGLETLAVRRKRICLINHDLDDGAAEEGRVLQDFWSK